MRQYGPARIICSLAFTAALFLLISAVSRYACSIRYLETAYLRSLEIPDAAGVRP